MSNSGPKPKRITLKYKVYKELKRISRSRVKPHALVIRARIILQAYRGFGTEEIAKNCNVSSRTVRKWKARFRKNPTLKGLFDLPRSGRPSKVPLWVRCKLIQIACDRPEDDTTPFRDVWTHKALSDRLWHETQVRLSTSEIGRILRFEKIRPHLVKQWLKSSDPNFIEKARVVCDLYLNPAPNSVVICVDEKPMQALERKYRTRVGDNGVVRYEYEYIRHGTAVLLGAFDVATGDAFGEVVPHRTADALVNFMEYVAERYPSLHVTIVWDNLNTHFDGPDKRWTRFNQRHGNRFHFVHTPLHASWMNQIEIWFSILHRRILKHGSFESVGELAKRVEDFMQHWNLWESHPFRWTWRTDKLKRQRKVA